MQSIDINLLIMKDHVREPSSSSNQRLFENTQKYFLDFFNEDDEALYFSNYKQETDALVFHLYIDKTRLCLYQDKKGKARSFIFDFEKAFLTLDKRKCEPSDFAKFSQQLRLVATHLLDKDVLFLSKPMNSKVSKTSSPLIIALRKKISTVYPFELIDEFCATDKVDRQEKIAKTLFRFSNQLKPVTKPGVMDHTKQLINKLKKTFRALLEDKYSKVLISNSRMKSSRINTIYSLLVSAINVVFVEKSSAMKNKLEFDMKSEAVVFNREPVTESGLQWFYEKTKKISRDLAAKRAELFLGSLIKP
ncbi:hypothetical protein DID77_01160 [Candidatus Marinamargulisbacteria bacterium SCGC AG-439-L15]|nr:hypothetical protein DID77_01160 [Candidatus Marinamargulisbacteria bacterium SCGC AG-439-L15]